MQPSGDDATSFYACLISTPCMHTWARTKTNPSSCKYFEGDCCLCHRLEYILIAKAESARRRAANAHPLTRLSTISSRYPALNRIGVQKRAKRSDPDLSTTMNNWYNHSDQTWSTGRSSQRRAGKFPTNLYCTRPNHPSRNFVEDHDFFKSSPATGTPGSL